MLDTLLRRHIEMLSTVPAARLAALGIRANAITVAGFVLCFAAVPDIGYRHYWLGLGLITLGRLFDVAGTAVARVEGPTDYGRYFRSVLDLVWSASVPFAFALGEPDRALAAMFLLIGLVARTAVLTADSGFARPEPSRLLEEASDLVGKSEIFIGFALACLFPNWFSIICYVLGLACFVMAGFRLAIAAEKRS